MTPKFSVAIATYNGEKYIEEQLESILSQTVSVDEIIVADDCSTDETVRIVEKTLIPSGISFEIIRQSENRGYTQNFYTAIDKCTGELILIADQDDVWLPHKVETVSNFIENHPETGILIHDVIFCDENLNRSSTTKLQRLKSLGIKSESYVAGMATCMTNQFWKNCFPLPSKETGWAYDSWIHACGKILGQRRVTNEVLGLFRRHATNATRGSLLNDYKESSSFKENRSWRLAETIKGLEQLQSQFRCLDHWIESNGLERFEDEGTRKRISAIRRKIRSVESRISALKRAWPFRVIATVRLNFAGFYREFNGVKSFAKDLLSR